MATKSGNVPALITNDQSDGLVDSALAGQLGAPVGQVAGGCFCCRMDQLVEVLQRLEGDTSAGGGTSEASGKVGTVPPERTVLTVLRGEHLVSGQTRRALRKLLPEGSRCRLSRLLKKLRLHGLIGKIARTNKYYLTKIGHRLLLTPLKPKQALIIPALCTAQ